MLFPDEFGLHESPAALPIEHIHQNLGIARARRYALGRDAIQIGSMTSVFKRRKLASQRALT